MKVFMEASLWELENVTASSNAQTPVQGNKEHQKSGKPDTTKGTE